MGDTGIRTDAPPSDPSTTSAPGDQSTNQTTQQPATEPQTKPAPQDDTIYLTAPELQFPQRDAQQMVSSRLRKTAQFYTAPDASYDQQKGMLQISQPEGKLITQAELLELRTEWQGTKVLVSADAPGYRRRVLENEAMLYDDRVGHHYLYNPQLDRSQQVGKIQQPIHTPEYSPNIPADGTGVGKSNLSLTSDSAILWHYIFGRDRGEDITLTAETIGPDAFGILKAYCTGAKSRPVPRAYFFNAVAFYDLCNSIALQVRQKTAGADPAIILDFSQALENFVTKGIDTTAAGRHQAMLAAMAMGMFKGADGIDFENLRVRFPNATLARQSLDKIAMRPTVIPTGFTYAPTHSMAIFTAGYETKAKGDDAMLPAADGWHWFDLVMGDQTRWAVAQASVEQYQQPVVSVETTGTTKKKKKGPSTLQDQTITLRHWADRMAEIIEMQSPPGSYRYFAWVVNIKTKLPELIEISGEMDPATGRPKPLASFDDVNDVTVDADHRTFDSKEEFQAAMKQQGEIITHEGMTFFNNPDFLFLTLTTAGEALPLYVVPRSYQTYSSAGYTQASMTATTKTLLEDEGKQKLGYLTFDVVESLNDYFNGILGTEGQYVYLNERGNAGDTKDEEKQTEEVQSKKIYNPVTKEWEWALPFRLALPTTETRQLILSIDAQLTAGDKKTAYPIDYYTSDNKKYWLPKDVTAEDAWLDPIEGCQGKTVQVGRYTMTRKQAAYLANILRSYIGNADTLGIPADELQKIQSEDYKASMKEGNRMQMLYIAMGVAGTVAGVAGLIMQKQYMKMLKEQMQSVGYSESEAKELAKKLMDPTWAPEFVTPLFNEDGKDKLYLLSDERKAELIRGALLLAEKKPVLFLGRSGVGKTALMEFLAQLLMTISPGEAREMGIPVRLLGTKLYALNTTEVKPGGTRGDFDKKVGLLLKWLKLRKGKVGLFTDEIQKLMGVSETAHEHGKINDGKDDFLSHFLEDFSRKRYPFAAATTPEYFASGWDQYDLDGAKKARFGFVDLHDNNAAEVWDIMRFLAPAHADRAMAPFLIWTEEAIRRVMELSDRDLIQTKDGVRQTNQIVRFSEDQVKAIQALILERIERPELMRLFQNVDYTALTPVLLDLEKKKTQLEDLKAQRDALDAEIRKFRIPWTAKKYPLAPRKQRELQKIKASIAALEAELEQLSSNMRQSLGDPALIPMRVREKAQMDRDIQTLEDRLQGAASSAADRAANLEALDTKRQELEDTARQLNELQTNTDRVTPERTKRQWDLIDRYVQQLEEVRTLEVRAGLEPFTRRDKAKTELAIKNKKAARAKLETVIADLEQARQSATQGKPGGLKITAEVVDALWSMAAAKSQATGNTPAGGPDATPPDAGDGATGPEGKKAPDTSGQPTPPDPFAGVKEKVLALTGQQEAADEIDRDLRELAEFNSRRATELRDQLLKAKGKIGLHKFYQEFQKAQQEALNPPPESPPATTQAPTTPTLLTPGESTKLLGAGLTQQELANPIFANRENCTLALDLVDERFSADEIRAVFSKTDLTNLVATMFAENVDIPVIKRIIQSRMGGSAQPSFQPQPTSVSKLTAPPEPERAPKSTTDPTPTLEDDIPELELDEEREEPKEPQKPRERAPGAPPREPVSAEADLGRPDREMIWDACRTPADTNFVKSLTHNVPVPGKPGQTTTKALWSVKDPLGFFADRISDSSVVIPSNLSPEMAGLIQDLHTLSASTLGGKPLDRTAFQTRARALMTARNNANVTPLQGLFPDVTIAVQTPEVPTQPQEAVPLQPPEPKPIDVVNPTTAPANPEATREPPAKPAGSRIAGAADRIRMSSATPDAIPADILQNGYDDARLDAELARLDAKHGVRNINPEVSAYRKRVIKFAWDLGRVNLSRMTNTEAEAFLNQGRADLLCAKQNRLLDAGWIDAQLTMTESLASGRTFPLKLIKTAPRGGYETLLANIGGEQGKAHLGMLLWIAAEALIAVSEQPNYTFIDSVLSFGNALFTSGLHLAAFMALDKGFSVAIRVSTDWGLAVIQPGQVAKAAVFMEQGAARQALKGLGSTFKGGLIPASVFMAIATYECNDELMAELKTYVNSGNPSLQAIEQHAFETMLTKAILVNGVAFGTGMVLGGVALGAILGAKAGTGIFPVVGTVVGLAVGATMGWAAEKAYDYFDAFDKEQQLKQGVTEEVAKLQRTEFASDWVHVNFTSTDNPEWFEGIKNSPQNAGWRQFKDGLRLLSTPLSRISEFNKMLQDEQEQDYAVKLNSLKGMTFLAAARHLGVKDINLELADFRPEILLALLLTAAKLPDGPKRLTVGTTNRVMPVAQGIVAYHKITATISQGPDAGEYTDYTTVILGEEAGMFSENQRANDITLATADDFLLTEAAADEPRYYYINTEDIIRLFFDDSAGSHPKTLLRETLAALKAPASMAKWLSADYAMDQGSQDLYFWDGEERNEVIAYLATALKDFAVENLGADPTQPIQFTAELFGELAARGTTYELAPEAEQNFATEVDALVRAWNNPQFSYVPENQPEYQPMLGFLVKTAFHTNQDFPSQKSRLFVAMMACVERNPGLQSRLTNEYGLDLAFLRQVTPAQWGATAQFIDGVGYYHIKFDQRVPAFVDAMVQINEELGLVVKTIQTDLQESDYTAAKANVETIRKMGFAGYAAYWTGQIEDVQHDVAPGFELIAADETLPKKPGESDKEFIARWTDVWSDRLECKAMDGFFCQSWNKAQILQSWQALLRYHGLDLPLDSPLSVNLFETAWTRFSKIEYEDLIAILAKPHMKAVPGIKNLVVSFSVRYVWDNWVRYAKNGYREQWEQHIAHVSVNATLLNQTLNQIRAEPGGMQHGSWMLLSNESFGALFDTLANRNLPKGYNTDPTIGYQSDLERVLNALYDSDPELKDYVGQRIYGESWPNIPAANYNLETHKMLVKNQVEAVMEYLMPLKVEREEARVLDAKYVGDFYDVFAELNPSIQETLDVDDETTIVDNCINFYLPQIALLCLTRHENPDDPAVINDLLLEAVVGNAELAAGTPAPYIPDTVSDRLSEIVYAYLQDPAYILEMVGNQIREYPDSVNEIVKEHYSHFATRHHYV